MPKLSTIADLAQWREKLAADGERYKKTITMCGGTGCQASGCLPVVNAMNAKLASEGLADTVHLRVTGCHGFCEQGPLMVIEPGNIFYCHISPDDIEEIVSRTIMNGELIDRLLYTDPVSGKKIQIESEIPFYRAQDRVLLGQNKLVDPTSVEDYVAIGGYSALAKTLTDLNSDQTIAEVEASGLRGRGGGGFPTGQKWRITRAQPAKERYIICNADEGDPGAYMDRSVLEGNPHAVLEGMLIGAHAIGADKGYIYVRMEYPLALRNVSVAIEQARTSGLLGQRILGTDLSFDVYVTRGAGAFVSGEETALIANIAGRLGEPSPKPPYPAERGVRRQPTNINNVETWANVPGIINNGAAWFAAKGTKGSKGTKIFALTGRVKNTGLVEVAMGTSLKTIVFDIGGGPSNGNAVKAVQTGGPSGGCLPVDKFDLPVDFDSLTEAGSMVGSGGMVVMDERTCMVDVAKYFLKFLQDESCGKCVPCRVGVDRMLEIVTDITEGRGSREQIDLLEDLAETVAQASLCALGKTAPNPVLSTLRYFRDEYKAHIDEKRCPAGVCRELIQYRIDSEKCTGCGVCLRACPHKAIKGEKKKPHAIDPEVCVKCGICHDDCKFEAVKIL